MNENRLAQVQHNLPRRDEIFVGRESLLKKIIAVLVDPEERAWIIAIGGIGGIGKTALVLEVGHAIFQTDFYDAIIWVSAKHSELSLYGRKAIPTDQIKATEMDLLEAIIDVLALERPPIDSREEFLKVVMPALKKAKCLIIVDNFEEVEDEGLKIFLRKLPQKSKAIITTREFDKLGQIEIELAELALKESVELFTKELERKGIILTSAGNPSQEQLEAICERAGNLPIAIKWIVGQMALTGQSTDVTLQRFVGDSSDVLKYCFDSCLPFLSPASWRILRIMPAFVTSVRSEIIEQVSRINDKQVLDQSLAPLHRMYLLKKDMLDMRYSILPATRIEIRRHWTAHPGLEDNINQSVAEYYLRFLTRTTASKQFQEIEAEHDNIVNIISWCDRKRHWERVVGLAQGLGVFLENAGHYTELAHLSLVGRYAAIEIGDREAEFKFTRTEGSACKYIEEYARSLVCFNACLDYYRDIDDKYHYALMVMQVGILSEHQALYSNDVKAKSREWYKLLEDAELHYLKSLEVFRSLNDSHREAILLHLLGRIQQYLEKYQKAEEYFRNSLKIKQERNDPEIAITEYQMAHLLHQKGQFLEAEDLFRKSLASLTNMGRAKDIANVKWYYSLLKRDMGDYEAALSLVKEAVEGFRNLGRYNKFSVAQSTYEEVEQYINSLRKSGISSGSFDKTEASDNTDQAYYRESSKEGPVLNLPLIWDKIVESYSEEELRGICFRLSVDYDDVPGKSKSSKARELVSRLEKHSRLYEIRDLLKEDRPHIDWDKLFLAN